MTRKLKIAAMAALLLLAGNAHSAYIDQGNYVEDTTSGLDWLKLSQTVGVSYDNRNTIAELSSGWRYATKVEVGALFEDFIPRSQWDINFNSDPSASSGAGNFIATFGASYDGAPGDGWYDYAWGYVDEFASASQVWTPWVGWDDEGGNYGIVGFDSLDATYHTSGEATLGHWLVRDNGAAASVPVPSALLLMLGIIGGLRLRNVSSRI